jgi:hypothetical protein
LRSDIDYAGVCTFPNFRLEAVELCAQTKKHVQVQKPITTSLDTARRMVETARSAGILLNVVSQHRFDESAQFLKRAIGAGRLGRILQADAYVKWFRPDAYYARSVKGSWAVEGGGALTIRRGACHRIGIRGQRRPAVRIRSNRSNSGSHRIQPGHPERLEFHGTRGTAIITGDVLTRWT